jgi:glutaredoxin
MKQSGLVYLLATVLLISVNCESQNEKPKGSPDAGIPGLIALKVTKEADHFLFTYLLADGSFKTVEKVEEVPEEARSQVIVIDTTLTPQQRKSSKIIYVADLTTPRENGTYACRPVSRFKFEKDLLREPGQASSVLPPQCEKLEPSPDDRIILYSTSWCGVCKAAASFLDKEKIPYVVKDVEKDLAAQQELTCKALKTSTRINGVPVLDIGGTLLLGFDRDDILRLAAALTKEKKPTQSPAD